MSNTIFEDKYGMGWLPDMPDFRDYTDETPEVAGLLKGTSLKKTTRTMKLDATVDLRQWFAPIPVEDQGKLGSCTANAGISLVEYFEQRAFKKHLDASRLFLYKVTRNMLHLTGDTGAYLRTTMGALALFGVPPEEYLPYDVAKFDEEPSAFCYAYASLALRTIYERGCLQCLASSSTVRCNRQARQARFPTRRQVKADWVDMQLWLLAMMTICRLRTARMEPQPLAL